MVNILRDILDEEVKPVYIFSGDDTYTKRRLEKEIEKKLIKKFGSCSVIILDGKEDNPRKIIDESSNSTLFASITLIIVKRGDIPLADENFMGFLERIGRMHSLTNIIIVETEKEIKKLKSFKIDTPYENQLPAWIKKNLNSKGKRISDDAANLLVFYCGRNLFNITRELEKIITAYSDKKSYCIEDVKDIAGAHKRDDIFGYLKALETADEKKSLQLLENLLRFGAEPIQIVSMLRWKLQQMITARALMKKGLDEKEIIAKMNLRPYFYRGFCSRLKRFTIEKLLKNYDRLCEIDLELKTTSTDKILLLEKFTFQFLTG